MPMTLRSTDSHAEGTRRPLPRLVLPCAASGSRQTPDLLPDFGTAWTLHEPHSNSGVGFPLTPVLSPGERENQRSRCEEARRASIARDGRTGTLSSGESAGVRGNIAHAVSMGSGTRSLRTPTKCARWVALALIALAAAQAGAQPAPELKTAESRASYAIGVDMARNLKRLGTEVDLDLVIRGMRDGLSGEKLIMPEKEFRQVLIGVQTVARRKQAQYRGHSVGEINLKRGELFLEENKAKAGVVALPSGLQYQVIKAGKGPKPAETDTVECYYRGTLLDGTEFICTNPGQPATVKVKEADCPGWKEALQLMPVGSKWKCYLPAKLAYGDRGVGRDIGPSETIILDLELLAIK